MRQLILRGSGSGFLLGTLVSDASHLTSELAPIRHADSSSLPTAATDFVDLLRHETARMGTV